ncbi:unnamed protein product [Soboliphyme baturini]|uniref:DUF1736 domain-containing protein n=1 Tax=Soboliphyme baturini TaxID=241478 RepID=A0A183IZP7_9BILA|nr:unnamed protein product [Soboliphyme baturini]
MWTLRLALCSMVKSITHDEVLFGIYLSFTCFVSHRMLCRLETSAFSGRTLSILKNVVFFMYVLGISFAVSMSKKYVDLFYCERLYSLDQDAMCPWMIPEWNVERTSLCPIDRMTIQDLSLPLPRWTALMTIITSIAVYLFSAYFLAKACIIMLFLVIRNLTEDTEEVNRESACHSHSPPPQYESITN